MKIVTINFDSIELLCRVKLNQSDSIDQGFEIDLVQLMWNQTNIKDILDQDKLIKLIFEQLKNL
jgi:hypothetical protein